MSIFRCARCKGTIRPDEECVIGDKGEDLHRVCPTLFGVSHAERVAPSPIHPDKGRQ
jgi:hypothetical protein